MSTLFIYNHRVAPIWVEVPVKRHTSVQPGKSASSEQHGKYSIVLGVNPVVSGQFLAKSNNVRIYATDIGDAMFKNNSKKLLVVATDGSQEDLGPEGGQKVVKASGEYQISLNDEAIIKVKFLSEVPITVCVS